MATERSNSAASDFKLCSECTVSLSSGFLASASAAGFSTSVSFLFLTGSSMTGYGREVRMAGGGNIVLARARTEERVLWRVNASPVKVSSVTSSSSTSPPSSSRMLYPWKLALNDSFEVSTHRRRLFWTRLQSTIARRLGSRGPVLGASTNCRNDLAE